MSLITRTLPLFPYLLALALGLGTVLLVPESWLFVSGGAVESAAPEGERYACPMTCVILDRRPPDDECPVCGMKLGVVATESAVNAAERRMVGLVAEELGFQRLEIELRLAGEVDYDERLVSVVSIRSQGWLEEVSRKVAWEEVQAGDVLFDIYSPRIRSAWSDYLVARGGGAEAARTALRALRNLGLDEKALATVRESDRASRLVSWHAPRDGVIIRRHAVQGAAVRSGEEIYAIADLSRVWLQVEVFERELDLLRLGTPIRGEIAGQPFAGTVAFLDPVVDRRSRTARVRVEVENHRRSDGTWALLPGQRFYGSARLPLGVGGDPEVGLEEAPPLLAVPRSAVLDTGRRKVVYVLHSEVKAADGTTERSYDLDPAALPDIVGYELVEVDLGPLARRADSERLEEYYPLRGVIPPPDHRARGSGSPRHALLELEPGMLLVTNGALLLDSQAQLAGRPSAFRPAEER